MHQLRGCSRQPQLSNHRRLAAAAAVPSAHSIRPRSSSVCSSAARPSSPNAAKLPPPHAAAAPSLDAAVPSTPPQPQCSRSHETDYVVIGSGIGGLCCGALLARYGHKVTVVESHYLPGADVRLLAAGQRWREHTPNPTTPLLT